MLEVTVKVWGIMHVVSAEEEKERLQWEGYTPHTPQNWWHFYILNDQIKTKSISTIFDKSWKHLTWISINLSTTPEKYHRTIGLLLKYRPLSSVIKVRYELPSKTCWLFILSLQLRAKNVSVYSKLRIFISRKPCSQNINSILCLIQLEIIKKFKMSGFGLSPLLWLGHDDMHRFTAASLISSESHTVGIC